MKCAHTTSCCRVGNKAITTYSHANENSEEEIQHGLKQCENYMTEALILQYMGQMKHAMLIKYECSAQEGSISMWRDRGRMISRIFVIILLLLCLLFMYLPIYYPLTFTKKSYDVMVDGWGFNASRSLPSYILPYNETAVISERTFCSERLLLLVIVCSSIGNVVERTAIRETWGNFSSPDYKIYFLMGISDNLTMQENIEIEANQYNDIIQENFIDSYNNLTLKSVMLLKQVVSHCNQVDFILKSDDDMFVHVINLLRFIKQVREMKIQNVLVGELICDAKPIQNSSSKWYAPTYMYDGKVYPRYLSGTGYLMDRRAAKKLYDAAMVTPFFHLEDVYITGMCAKKADIKPRYHAGFSYQTRPLDPCIYISNDYIITSHRVTPTKMRLLWTGLNNNTCPRKPRLRQPMPRRNARCT